MTNPESPPENNHRLDPVTEAMFEAFARKGGTAQQEPEGAVDQKPVFDTPPSVPAKLPDMEQVPVIEPPEKPASPGGSTTPVRGSRQRLTADTPDGTVQENYERLRGGLELKGKSKEELEPHAQAARRILEGLTTNKGGKAADSGD